MCCNNSTNKQSDVKDAPWTKNFLQKEDQPIWTSYFFLQVGGNLLENNYYAHTPLRRGEKVFL